MLDCAKSELIALAESKTPIQSLKDDLKPGDKLELLSFRIVSKRRHRESVYFEQLYNCFSWKC
jgi:hypothetical protein